MVLVIGLPAIKQHHQWSLHCIGSGQPPPQGNRLSTVPGWRTVLLLLEVLRQGVQTKYLFCRNSHRYKVDEKAALGMRYM